MRLWKVLLVAAVAAVVSTGSAWAQEKKKSEKPKMTQEELFKRLDKDSSGDLSKEEFLARAGKKPEMKEKLEAQFTKLDKDNNGKVTLDEFKAGAVRGGKKKKTQ